MNLYSTKHTVPEVDFRTALFQGLPSDNGLYMPDHIPVMPDAFFEDLHKMTFAEQSFQIAHALIGEEIPGEDLREIINQAINFAAPVINVAENRYCLELFHGPSLAFKDFGARFMAGVMAWYLKEAGEKIHILVATSGDTGSAVAQGFYNMPGIEVIILYPSGKVSITQEKQLTTLGQNVTALEINGVFDDCQRLVKSAFLDEDLQRRMNLSSANSINIARLIPQTFYYVHAFGQLKHIGRPIVFSVPSGNFGNICGGMIAHKMGLPVERFIAATNVNDVVPEYLETGIFAPRPSIATISNAMDVGNPSNFPRILELWDQDIEKVREKVFGVSISDEATKEAIKLLFEKHKYLACPHTAVAWLGLEAYFEKTDSDALGIFLSTAHPSKFTDVIEPVIRQSVEVPERLQQIILREKESILMEADFEDFKDYLLSRL